MLKINQAVKTVTSVHESATLIPFAREANGKGGGLKVHLQPAKGWRELALKGVIAMNYRISGQVILNGFVRKVNVTIPCVKDNELDDLGNTPSGRWFLHLKDGEVHRVPSLPSDKFDACRIESFTNDAGVAEASRDENGEPIILEAPIPGFDMRWGCVFFIPTHSLATLEFTGVEITDRGGDEYLDLSYTSFKVVDVPRREQVTVGKRHSMGMPKKEMPALVEEAGEI